MTGRTVLLVEDEVNSLEAMAEHLKRHGYSITACSDGEEAIAQRCQHDILITDWHLGDGVTGADVAIHLGRRWPALTIIVISAYPEQMVLRWIGRARIAAFLAKPLSLERLRAVIDESISKSGTPPGARGGG